MGNFGEATTVILTLSMRVRCAYVCPSREYSLRVVFSVRRADVSGVVWRRVTCSRVCVRAEWPWASVRVRGTLREVHALGACGSAARADPRSSEISVTDGAARGVSATDTDYRTERHSRIRRVPRAISESVSSFFTDAPCW